MAKSFTPISTHSNQGDTFIEANPNPNGGGNVEAFVNRFKPYARQINAQMHFPICFLLGFGGENPVGVVAHAEMAGTVQGYTPQLQDRMADHA